MSDWLLDFELDPNGRYHVSPAPIQKYKVTFDQKLGDKPKGLWYGCGNAWLDFLVSEVPKWLDSINYLYQIIPGSQVKMIRTLEELDKFSKDYGTREHEFSVYDVINWPAAEARWSGIEICPYQPARRGKFDWYKSWDVASGCLWAGSDHQIRLAAQNPDSAQAQSFVRVRTAYSNPGNAPNTRKRTGTQKLRDLGPGIPYTDVRAGWKNARRMADQIEYERIMNEVDAEEEDDE